MKIKHKQFGNVDVRAFPPTSNDTELQSLIESLTKNRKNKQGFRGVIQFEDCIYTFEHPITCPDSIALVGGMFKCKEGKPVITIKES